MELLIIILGIIYTLICIAAYLIQEELLFHPEKLAQDFIFRFEVDFEEVYVEMEDGVHLHALHFKAENPKGIVFYVHGNAGSLDDWGGLSDMYADLNYDLFMFDYRGFGKSQGKIFSQAQFFGDVQALYDYVKILYTEDQIIVQSFSIGTAAAVKLVLENKPQQLILKAPYYSLSHLVKSRYFFLPMTLLKYKFKTIDFLKKIEIPVTMFHGTTDELIPFSNAELLQKEVPTIDFVPIDNCLHNDLPYSDVYKEKMRVLLK
jgi:pimeloyl-ACP methyl ester carboxylesterase